MRAAGQEGHTYAVGIISLATPAEVEAAALASEIGLTLYEARLELAAGTPAIVLLTPDRARAARQVESIRARGHAAVAFDTTAVIGSDRMIAMRRFRLDASAVTAEDGAAELPYDDVFVLVHAQHRRETERREEIKTRALSGTRAILTGGVLLTKKVTEQVRSTVEEREQVLYLYRRSGGVPWILRERNTSYAGLGSAALPTQLENFKRTVTELRERMPSAKYDDRLLSMRKVRSAISSSLGRGIVESSSAGWMDLLAHVVALAVARSTSDPYRT
jgi:hypothetical protein